MGGTSGIGKSTIGNVLATRLGWTFEDSDALHSPAQIAKMRSGQPLTDADRWPWLETVAAWMDQRIAAGESAVLACSVLKRSYRDYLYRGRPAVQIVHPAGRSGHARGQAGRAARPLLSGAAAAEPACRPGNAR